MRKIIDQLLIQQLAALTADESDYITNMANVCALIMQASDKVNWVGFYRYIPKSNHLLLGPYQGPLACNVIPNGRGVCGQASLTLTTQVVPDVNQFKGHIACDSHTKSEIVIPMSIQNQVIGVLDLDSNYLNAFTSKDKRLLEQMVMILVKNSDIISK